LAQAERVAQIETYARCAQAMAFGIEDLRRQVWRSSANNQPPKTEKGETPWRN
jgi:hypothetical protein